LQPKRYQIFVSSTYTDLVKEREDAIKAIVDFGHLPSGMEGFPAIDMEQFKYIKKVIDQCDYYILIVGDRYGSVAPDGISFTEKEYHYAVDNGQVVLAFVKETQDESAQDERLSAFKTEVMTGRLVHLWKDGDDLKYPIRKSLQEAFDQQPRAGWVRVDQSAGQSEPPRLTQQMKGWLVLAAVLIFLVGGVFAIRIEHAMQTRDRQLKASASSESSTSNKAQAPPVVSPQPESVSSQPEPTLSAEELATKLSIWESVSTSNYNSLANAFNSIDAAQARWTRLIGSADGRHQLHSDLAQATTAYMKASNEIETLKLEYPKYQDVATALTQPNRQEFARAAENFANAINNVSESDVPPDLEVRLRPLAGALKRELNTTQKWLNSLSRIANAKRAELSDVK
jgi:hypothetical protein